MSSGILLYKLGNADGIKLPVDIAAFEDIVLSEPALSAFKTYSSDSLALYFENPALGCGLVAKCVYRFLQKLFNSTDLPSELADFDTIVRDKCAEYMLTDSYPFFAWSLAVDGKIIGAQIYLT